MNVIFRLGFISDLNSRTRQRANTCQDANFNLFHFSTGIKALYINYVLFLQTFISQNCSKLFFMKVNEKVTKIRPERLRYLLVSSVMTFSSFPSSLATPDAVTLDHHSPEIPGDVSNASLTCTAIAVYPVSNISWNVSGVLEHQWKNVVKQDKNSSLFNISSTAFFNCSDGSTRLIRCFLGGVSSDEKIVCQQPKGECHLGT